MAILASPGSAVAATGGKNFESSALSVKDKVESYAALTETYCPFETKVPLELTENHWNLPRTKPTSGL